MGRRKNVSYSQLWFHRESWGVHLRRVKCSHTDGTECSLSACSLLLLIARRLIAPSPLAVCYDHKRGFRSFVTFQIRNTSALSTFFFVFISTLHHIFSASDNSRKIIRCFKEWRCFKGPATVNVFLGVLLWNVFEWIFKGVLRSQVCSDT